MIMMLMMIAIGWSFLFFRGINECIKAWNSLNVSTAAMNSVEMYRRIIEKDVIFNFRRTLISIRRF